MGLGTGVVTGDFGLGLKRAKMITAKSNMPKQTIVFVFTKDFCFGFGSGVGVGFGSGSGFFGPSENFV